MRVRKLLVIFILIEIFIPALAQNEIGSVVRCYKDFDRDGYCQMEKPLIFTSIYSCIANGGIPKEKCIGFENIMCDTNANLNPKTFKICDPSYKIKGKICIVLRDSDKDGYPIIAEKRLIFPIGSNNTNSSKESIWQNGIIKCYSNRASMKDIILDCNDKNSLIHPGAKELCDGIDNNCNGKIDENCIPDENDKIITLRPGKWYKVGYIPLDSAIELVENGLAKYVCYYLNGYICVKKSNTGEVYVGRYVEGRIERLPDFQPEPYMAAFIKPIKTFEWPVQRIDSIIITNPYDKLLTFAVIPTNDLTKIKVECTNGKVYILGKTKDTWIAYNLVNKTFLCYKKNRKWGVCNDDIISTWKIEPYVGNWIYVYRNCTVTYNYIGVEEPIETIQTLPWV